MRFSLESAAGRTMPKGPQGQKRPADAIGNALHTKAVRLCNCSGGSFAVRRFNQKVLTLRDRIPLERGLDQVDVVRPDSAVETGGNSGEVFERVQTR